MQVVSLAPSATATVAALGAADSLVGVTQHCTDGDAPAVGGWLNPDYDRLADLDPDVVLTSDALQRDVRDECCDRGFDVHHAEPATLDDVLDSFSAIGAAVGRPDAGRELERESRERVDRVADHREATWRRTATDESRVADHREATSRANGEAVSRERPASPAPDHAPVVYCEEWSDPPMAAGNWVPDAVRAAGGRYPFAEPGERSREVEGDAVRAADPEHAVVHVCGKGDRVDADPAARWNLDADVHVVDDSLLNQPSPRLIDGIEHLADVFRGD